MATKDHQRGNVETYWTHQYVLYPQQRRLRWLGHILRMGVERIPKFMLYSELVGGRYKLCRPTLRFKDVCKRYLKSLNVGTDKWEDLSVNDRDKWRFCVYKSLKVREKNL